jgi:hypothetical protein
LLNWQQYINSLILEKSIVSYRKEPTEFYWLEPKIKEFTMSLESCIPSCSTFPSRQDKLSLEIYLKPCESQLIRVCLLPFLFPLDVITLITNYYSDEKGSLLFKKPTQIKHLLFFDHFFHPDTFSWTRLEWRPFSGATFNPKRDETIILNSLSFALNYKKVKQILNDKKEKMKEETGGIKTGYLDDTFVWTWNGVLEPATIHQITTDIILKTIDTGTETKLDATEEVQKQLKTMIHKRMMTGCLLCSCLILQLNTEPQPYKIWLHCKCEFERLETIWTIYDQAIKSIPN